MIFFFGIFENENIETLRSYFDIDTDYNLSLEFFFLMFLFRDPHLKIYFMFHYLRMTICPLLFRHHFFQKVTIVLLKW